MLSLNYRKNLSRLPPPPPRSKSKYAPAIGTDLREHVRHTNNVIITYVYAYGREAVHDNNKDIQITLEFLTDLIFYVITDRVPSSSSHYYHILSPSSFLPYHAHLIRSLITRLFGCFFLSAVRHTWRGWISIRFDRRAIVADPPYRFSVSFDCSVSIT
jgi:hypothetical protein